MHAPRWWRTLKARLMLLWAVVIAACVLGATLALLHRVEQRSVQAVTALEAEHMGSVAGIIGQRVVVMQRTLRLVAQQVPQTALSDPAAARKLLSDRPALGAHFDTTFIADADGKVLALQDGAIVSTPPMNVAAMEYFRLTLVSGVPVVSSPVSGGHFQGTVVVFTMPLFDGHQRVAGVVGGSVRLAERNLLDDLTYAASDGAARMFTVISDARGTIVAHPRQERVGASVGSEPRLAAAWARWSLQGQPVEPSADVWREGGQFLATVGVPGADWMVFRAVPEGELLGDMAQARREAFAWAGAVALAGALLMLGALTHLLGPLNRLRQRALRMNDPALAADAGWPEASGEIGDLCGVLRNAQVHAAELGKDRQLHLQQMRSVMASAPIGIGFTRDRRYELVSAEFCAILGYHESDLIGRQASDTFASQQEYAELGPRVGAAFAAGKPFNAEMQFLRRDGSTVWCELQGRPVDASNPRAGTIWLLEDVTDRRAERERLRWSASHDMLTRLLNRAAFEQRLAELLAIPGPGATLLMLDLDRFKQVNDAAGHAAGDQVLRQVAALLLEHVRGGDAAARLGGDEFALLLPACDAEQGLVLADKLLRATPSLGVMHQGQWLGVGLSIGVLGLEPGAGAGPHEPLVRAEACMTRADEALYEAKRGGRGRACLAPARATAPVAVAVA